MARSAPHPRTKSRILVVDDQPLFRKGLTEFINQQPDLEVGAHAGTVPAAMDALESFTPHLVLLGLRVGNTDVFDLIKGLKKLLPDMRVLVLSQYDEPMYAERALRAGADGYVLKEETPEEIMNAIYAALAGELYVTHRMASSLLHKLIQRKPVARDATVEVLSDRELHVFRLLGAGLSSRKIAADLHLSIKTIETYRENIKHKLGLRNASELIRRATQWLQSSSRPASCPPERTTPDCDKLVSNS
jgi:DNA-binding NarL/FixJ family response regulator